jgi:hypothetical protein
METLMVPFDTLGGWIGAPGSWVLVLVVGIGFFELLLRTIRAAGRDAGRGDRRP